jgi:hypothetical protein
VQYANITGSALNVRSAEEVKYANITGCALHARSAEEAQYANITGGAVDARSVEEVQYANITGSAIIARSVVVMGFACITGGALRVNNARVNQSKQRNLPNEPLQNGSDPQSEKAVTMLSYLHQYHLLFLCLQPRSSNHHSIAISVSYTWLYSQVHS